MLSTVNLLLICDHLWEDQDKLTPRVQTSNGVTRN